MEPAPTIEFNWPVIDPSAMFIVEPTWGTPPPVVSPRQVPPFGSAKLLTSFIVHSPRLEGKPEALTFTTSVYNSIGWYGLYFATDIWSSVV